MKSEKQLYQWDINQHLTELKPEAQFVDYPMGNEVIRIETDGKRCRIPDEFLQSAGFKTCYERYSDGTYKAYSFNVLSSPKPPDYVYTAEERTTFEALVEKADTAMNCSRIVFENQLTPGIIGSKNEIVKSNIISDRLATISHADYWDDSFKSSGINVFESLQAVCFRLHDRTDIDTKEKAKAWLAENPTTVYYEIEPEELADVTIPEALTEWLPVEPGGTVTFRNADESKQLAVPNAVSWVRKLNEVN